MSPPSPSPSFKGSGNLQPRQQDTIRPHPPRLQHSPSLPNIWFPPRSRPVPPKLERMSRDSVHHLYGSESSVKLEAQPQGSERQPEPQPSLISYRGKPQTSRPHVKILSQKSAGKRQRVEDEPHKLLTPPLTPSSSIRTTTSVDSSVGRSDGFSCSEVTGGDEDVAGPSRLLRVDNISLDVSQEVIKNAISSSITTSKLACYRHDPTLPTPVTPSTKGGKVQNNCAKFQFDNPIRGLLLRAGFIILAFHDLRDAIAAHKYFETRESDVFDDCVIQSKDGTGRRRLTCMFLSMDQVTIEMGVSTFLKSMDASIEIMIESEVSAEEVTTNLQRLSHDQHTGKKKNSSGIATREIVLLQTDLKAFGDIRSFSDTTAPDEGQGLRTGCKMFRVEFFDIRATTAAYEALVDRPKMKYKVCKREELENVKPMEHADPDIIQANVEITPIVPFPISRSFDDCIQPFGPPGLFSQTRQPFPVNGPLNDDSRRNATPISSENRESPPVFYHTSENHVAIGQSVGINGRFPGEGDALGSQQLLQNYYTGFAYPTLDRVPNLGPPMHYFAPTPTPPIAFHPGYLSPPPPSHFPGPGPIHAFPRSMIPLDRDPASIQQMNMTWPIEMTNGIPAYSPGFPFNGNIIPPVFAQDPYRLQCAAATSFSGSTPSPGAPRVPVPPYSDEFSFPTSSGHDGYPWSCDSPSSSRPARNSLASSGKKGSSEHNQLNLAKIESGIDTRTTLMIKNIPNKMTNKDLVQYIAKVCPRRIDFIYLRIDFKNGCNVGYAFVNFISVEDLVLFAKARLGQKWNMFSSKKVLQMSYADYQGKEALVEKFKNSCIMDEREAWQPKIFYSESGPEQGLPEPFPPATHQRRKERSSHNRGALFVPGNSSLQMHNLLNAPFSARKLDNETHRDRNHRRQRTTTSRQEIGFVPGST